NDGEYLFDRLVSHFELGDTGIVCEAVPLDVDGNTLYVFMHVFVSRDTFLKYVGDGKAVGVSLESVEMYSRMSAETAIQFVLLILEIEAARIGDMPGRFRHTSWQWVVSERLARAEPQPDWIQSISQDQNPMFLYRFAA